MDFKDTVRGLHGLFLLSFLHSNPWEGFLHSSTTAVLKHRYILMVLHGIHMEGIVGVAMVLVLTLMLMVMIRLIKS